MLLREFQTGNDIIVNEMENIAKEQKTVENIIDLPIIATSEEATTNGQTENSVDSNGATEVYFEPVTTTNQILNETSNSSFTSMTAMMDLAQFPNIISSSPDTMKTTESFEKVSNMDLESINKAMSSTISIENLQFSGKNDTNNTNCENIKISSLNDTLTTGEFEDENDNNATNYENVGIPDDLPKNTSMKNESIPLIIKKTINGSEIQNDLKNDANGR